MNIFKEASKSKKAGTGYKARHYKILWRSKVTKWKYLSVAIGIRWSNVWQLFPIWNMSDNSSRTLIFGVWKLYFEISFHRGKNCNYLFKMPFFHAFRKVYLLLF